MIVDIHYSNTEKQRIAGWKRNLPPNAVRKFAYGFVENGKISDDGEKIYNFLIKSSDGHVLKVADDVTL